MIASCSCWCGSWSSCTTTRPARREQGFMTPSLGQVFGPVLLRAHEGPLPLPFPEDTRAAAHLVDDMILDFPFIFSHPPPCSFAAHKPPCRSRSHLHPVCIGKDMLASAQSIRRKGHAHSCTQRPKEKTCSHLNTAPKGTGRSCCYKHTAHEEQDDKLSQDPHSCLNGHSGLRPSFSCFGCVIILSLGSCKVWFSFSIDLGS